MDSEHLGESLGRPRKEVGVEQTINTDELTALGNRREERDGKEWPLQFVLG